MTNKPFSLFLIILILLAVAGLGYAGWQDSRDTGNPGWTPPALPASLEATQTATPGWWGNLPTRPSRYQVTPTQTGTPTP
jgi:hypothetical protein